MLGIPHQPAPVQNPQREFEPPVKIDGDTNGAAQGDDDTTANPATTKPAQPKTAEHGMMMDPLAITAIEQAQGNDDMLFTGLGGMPRPLTSPYLYSDLATTGGFHPR